MTTPDPGTDPFLAPPLGSEQLTLLRRYGEERTTTVGQVLFREGDLAYDFIVVAGGRGHRRRSRRRGGAGAGDVGSRPVPGRAQPS